MENMTGVLYIRGQDDIGQRPQKRNVFAFKIVEIC